MTNIMIKEVPVLAMTLVEPAGVDGVGDQVGAGGAKMSIEKIYVPPKGEGAEILEGDDEEVVEQLVAKLREQGGL